MMFQKFQTLVH